MKPAPPKPDYTKLVGTNLTKIRSLYQSFSDRNKTAWHAAYAELHYLQSGGTKSYPRVFSQVWDTYDLRTRAVLFLAASKTGSLSRSSLQMACDESHSYSLTQLNSYRARFGDSMFNHYCDLPMTIGEIYPLRTPSVANASVECVISGFAYYFKSVARGREYCTLRDGELYLLETADYDCQLEYDWDGKCEYIY